MSKTHSARTGVFRILPVRAECGSKSVNLSKPSFCAVLSHALYGCGFIALSPQPWEPPQPLQPAQPQPQDEPPFFLLRMMNRMQKNNAAATSRITMISVMSAFLLPVSDTVQVPPVNEPCFLQGLYHPVYGSNPHRLILFPKLVTKLYPSI